MRIFLSLAFLFLFACKTNNSAVKMSTESSEEFAPIFASGPPVLVYKTKANYYNLVPVILSEDKTEIVSYPDPGDLINKISLPTPLHAGYLLDNRGIGKNVAFLKITYEEYSTFENIPSLKELYNSILDKDPLVELCDCGINTAFTDKINQLNNLIDDKRIRTSCKAIK